MTTMTKSRRAEPSPPPTFADIAHKKMLERIEGYRRHLRRAVDGEQLNEADLSEVSDLLAVMSLPDYAWALHIEAVKRHDIVSAKLKAALDAAPGNRQRSLELAAEIEVLQPKLRAMMEEQRIASVRADKGSAYEYSLRQLESEHAVALGDIDTAVTLRLAELNRRKAGGVS
jgi:hypothetical protein